MRAVAQGLSAEEIAREFELTKRDLFKEVAQLLRELKLQSTGFFRHGREIGPRTREIQLHATKAFSDRVRRDSIGIRFPFLDADSFTRD